jgi:hypothetical protein
MFRFNTLRIDLKPMKGVVVRGKTPTEQVVTDLGVRLAIGWKSFLLGLLFVTLKVTGHISWPWLWVTMPFWLGPLIGLGMLLGIACFLLVFLVVAGIVVLLDR